MAGPVNRCYPLTLENMVEGPDVQMTLEPADVAVTEMGSGRGNRYSGIRGPISPTFFPHISALTLANRVILEGRDKRRQDKEKYVNTEAKETLWDDG